MRSADENQLSVGGSHRASDLMIAVLAVFWLVAYPGRAAGGEAGREKKGGSESQAPASRASERPDPFRERERERKEMGFERPDERQRFFIRKRSPDGVSPLPMEKYVKALEQMEQMPQYSTVAGRILPSRAELAMRGTREALGALGTWSWLGPGNVGGRTRALLVHPTTPSIMYAAGVSGGIWKSTDAGASWTPLADLMANINVCTLAMDPRDPNVIYAGTGGMFEGGVGVIAQTQQGAGIFKTTDGGTNWKQLPATNTWDFHVLSKIVVSPLASNRVYAGTFSGVWRSTDSGATWTRVLATSYPEMVGDLVIRSDKTTDVVLAVDIGYSGQGTIYRNLDAGGAGSWTAVYSEPKMGRTSLAIAPSSQETMYALSKSFETGNYQNGLLAVFRSTDGGSTWVATVRNTDVKKLNTLLLSNPLYAMTSDLYINQGDYDNVIAVDPLDPNRVWAGGIDLFRSDDGGANWGLASYWWFNPTPSTAYAHADHHAIVFHPQYNGTTNQTMFVGNDGGLFQTDNAVAATSTDIYKPGAVTWKTLNNGYGVTQFYFGLPYPDGETYFGGTQDNGSVRGTGSGGLNAWIELLRGDGGCVAVDPRDTNILYAENIGLSMLKSTNGGVGWAAATSGMGVGGLDNQFNWIVPFVMDPSNSLNLWTGGQKPMRTTNGATAWVQAGASFPPAPPGFSNDVATAVAVAPTDSNYVLFGLRSGAVARSHTALTDSSSSVWAQVRPVQDISYSSSLTFDPTNKNIAYVTYAMFGVPHVWKSTDGGATFASISGIGVTGIPDIPVHSIVVDPTNTSRLYIGTDLGVFTSIDGGANWAVENTGFANVITESLAITGSKLFAFTYGRGAYRVSLTQCTTSPTATASGGGTICSGTSASVQAALTGTGPWGVTWSDGAVQTGVLTSPATRSVNPSVTTTYTVTAVSDFNCASGTSSGGALVTVNPMPAAPTITQTAGTNPSCVGASITLDAGAGYASYAWSTGATTRAITVSPAITTSYAVTGTTTGCTSAPGNWSQTVNQQPVVTAPSFVGAGSPNRVASVVSHAGSSYAWSIANGTITAGQGTSQITFTAGTAGVPLTLSVTETIASGCVSAPGNATVTVAPAGSADLFYTVPPCRIVDTRNANGPLGGPSLSGGSTRTFAISNQCGIPAGATSVSVNVTITNPTAQGHLTFYPTGVSPPLVSTINFRAGQTRANNAILPLGPAGDFVVSCAGTGTVDFILDINGYFR